MTNVPFINSITNELSKRKLKSDVVANAILDIAVGNDRLDDLIANGVTQSDLESLTIGGLTTEQTEVLGKIEGLQASASEIDDTIENGTIKPLKYASLNGTSSYVTLDQDYILAVDGDYFEFICKWDNLSSSPNTTLGLFGKNDGTSNNCIGVNGTPLNLYVRGSSSTFMIFNIANVLTFNAGAFNKYRLDVVGTNLRLTINGIVISSVALASPITINNIGKTYGTNFVAATITSFTIHTSLNEVVVTNLLTETRFTKIDIVESIFYKAELSYSYDGLSTFLIYKKQSNGKYIVYIYKRTINPAKNADNWRINIIALCDENFTVTRYLTNGGEVETAFMFKEGATLASDHAGGEYHGDEVLTKFAALIDGVKVSTSVKHSGICSKIEFVQVSNLFCPTGLSFSGTNVVDVTKRWVFNAKEHNKLANKVTFTRNMTVEDAYMFMMPIKRTDGLGQITDTFMVSPLYEEIDVTSSGHSNRYYVGNQFGGNVRMWSTVSNVSLDINVLKGWDRYSTARYNTSPEVQFNKAYINMLKTQDVLKGDIIEAEFEYDVVSR